MWNLDLFVFKYLFDYFILTFVKMRYISEQLFSYCKCYNL